MILTIHNKYDVIVHILIYQHENKCVCAALTEVEKHANENDEAEPGTEVRHKIDDGNDDVSNSGYNAEHNIAVKKINDHLSTISLRIIFKYGDAKIIRP